MPEDTNIPLPAAPESSRAAFQALAERVGVLAPGAPLSDELMNFAEGVLQLAAEGQIDRPRGMR